MKKKPGEASRSGGPPPDYESNSVLKERISWIQKSAWTVVLFYTAVFVGLVEWYLPKEFESLRTSVKVDIGTAIDPVRLDVARLSERLSKQVGFDLQSLVPSAALARSIDPVGLKARLLEANSLIHAAIAERVPTAPATLSNTRVKLVDTIQNTKLPGDVRNAATTALVGLEAYSLFSSTIVLVPTPKIVISRDSTFYAPVTIDKPVWLEGTGKMGAAVTVDFTGTHPKYPHPAAFVVGGGETILSRMRVQGKNRDFSFLILSAPSKVLVTDSQIVGLTQSLAGITWLGVDFIDSTIQYRGEPAYLGNVTFTNCRFDFGTDPVSKWLLEKVSGHTQPLTLASSASLLKSLDPPSRIQ